MASTLNERAWALCARIPEGKVTTYAQIAHALGTRAYRAVGQAMNKNPYPHTKVPCHRVVMSDGSLGGFAHEPLLKIARLKADGVRVKDDRIVDFQRVLHRF